MLRKA